MKVLFHDIVSKENHHTIYSQFCGRSIWHTGMQNTEVLSCGLISEKRALVILPSVLSGLSLLPLMEEASPSVVWTMMIMLGYILISSDFFASAPSSSTLINATFLSWFKNLVTRNFRMSRRVRLLMDGNPKGCEIAYYIATKVELNPQMILTLKNEKSIWSMNPGETFET